MATPKSNRSCGNPFHKPVDRMSDVEVLEASWDYWERQGWPHPRKRRIQFIKPLVAVPKEEENET